MEPAQHEGNWQDLTHIIKILIEKYLSVLKYYIQIKSFLLLYETSKNIQKQIALYGQY